MKAIHKRTFQISTAIAAVAVFGLLTPKAAHALAAALVQVTNTAADPVVVQSVGGQAAQIVDIGCVGANPGTTEGCATVSGAGTFSPPTYAVPANQTLVITAVDIQPLYSTTPSQCSAPSAVVVTTNGSTRKAWIFTGTNTLHYDYPTGFLLSSGQVLGDVVGPTSACGAAVEMYGYLTAN